MTPCPKTAPAFNPNPISEAEAIAWCQRRYSAKLEQCNGCELGVKFGVIKATVAKGATVQKVEQGRLF